MTNIAKKMLTLASSPKTVFSVAELALFWGTEDKNILRVTISRAKEKGYLEKIQRGLYKLADRDADPLELAVKLKKNSYISFETVLAQTGVIFQWHDEIICAALRSSKIENRFGKFSYRKIPEHILKNNIGIVNKENYFIASAERALCDKIYKNGLSYFDSLSGIDRGKVMEISRIYGNVRLENDISKLFKL